MYMPVATVIVFIAVCMLTCDVWFTDAPN